MDTATLRWILLILGLLLLAGIYFWGRYQPLERLREKKHRPEPIRNEPVLDPEALPEVEAEEEPAALPDDAADESEPEPLPHEQLVIIRIVGKQGAWLRGPEICLAADRSGLVHQDGLFHRVLESEAQEQIWYSLANVQEPGTFDLDQIDGLQTPAILLYFPLPTPMGALDSFDAMLATAERLAELLDGRLLDDSGNPLARQGIVHLRDRLRLYDREHG